MDGMNRSRTVPATDEGFAGKLFACFLGCRRRINKSLLTGMMCALGMLGFGNQTATGQLRINEFMAAPLSGNDWVEIYNPGGAAVNLSDYYLTDNDGNLLKWRFPNPSSIAANGYYVVGLNGAVSGGSAIANFALDAGAAPDECDGEYLALVYAAGGVPTVVHEFSPGFPEQHVGISYGTASSGQVGFLCPTLGAVNGGICVVGAPQFSHASGYFDTPFTLTISCATAGATLLYTVNGTEPRDGNPTAISATLPMTIAIDHTTTLRVRTAAASLAPMFGSRTFIREQDVPFQPDVTTQGFSYALPTSWYNSSSCPAGFPADYRIDSRVVNASASENGFTFQDALESLPAISILCDSNHLFGFSQGIYPNSLKKRNEPPSPINDDPLNKGWERCASVEMFFPDGSPGFQVHSSIETHGGASAMHSFTPKHSIEFFFKDTSQLQFPMFPGSPVSTFRKLLLRACSTDSWANQHWPGNSEGIARWYRHEASYLRDQWMRDTQLAMGHPSVRGRYVHLYLNGLYWGVYNIVEPIDENYAANHLGGNPEDYDIIESAGLKAGSLNIWNTATTTASTPGNDSQFWSIQGKNPPDAQNPDGSRNNQLPILVDMDNYIDYMILHIFAGSDDWPNNNWYAVRKHDSAPNTYDSSGFKFLVWDQEIAISSLQRQMNSYGARFQDASAGVAGFYSRFVQNSPAFRQRFTVRLNALMANGGMLTPAANYSRWVARANEINKAIVAESARWGDARENLLTPCGSICGELMCWPVTENFPYRRNPHWLANQTWMVNTFWPGNHPIASARFASASPGAPTYNLLPDPFVTTHPVSQTIQDGGSTQFSITAQGSGTLTYEWRLNGVPIPGATSSSLTRSGVSSADAGHYTVIVRGSAGTATSEPAVLTVLRNEFVWIEDAPPAGATLASNGQDSWNDWVGSSELEPFSGTLSLRSSIGNGLHQMHFWNAPSPMTISSGDVLFAYAYVDPANPPSEIMLQWYTTDGTGWEHRAYWGDDLLNWFGGRNYMGPLPTSGQWVRLEVPARIVDLEGRSVTGMAFTLYDGRVNWDRAGKRTGGDLLWIEDGLPPGPYEYVAGSGDDWSNWVTHAPRPFSGNAAIQSSIFNGGLHQLYFGGTKDAWLINPGDVVFAYVYLDPSNPPDEIMLQWLTTDNTWWHHRAYWGPDLMNGFGTRTYMGPLPALGQWVRLEVPVSSVDLAGRVIKGMAFTLHNGRATWDHAGKRAVVVAPDSLETVWIEDAPPQGTLGATGDSWENWGASPAPFSGDLALTSGLNSGFHQLWYTDAPIPPVVREWNRLFAYVYIDPLHPPQEIMLQWFDGISWDHRAYWGSEVTGLLPATYMGNLPPSGQWVLLEVYPSDVNLKTGTRIMGGALTVYGGRVSWDKVGKDGD